MALTDIHTWADDETVTHTDLNSIATAVSTELGSGNINSNSFAWPLVAYGNIDMNGNNISNLGSYMGVYHVNDDQSLSDALGQVPSGGTIVIDPRATAYTVADISVTNKDNITIVGMGDTCVLDIGASITNYGLKFDTQCSNITIKNVKVTGGKTSTPGIWFEGGSHNRVEDCWFYGVDGYPLQLGTASVASSYTAVKNSLFHDCVQHGLYIEGGNYCQIDNNMFEGCVSQAMQVPGYGSYVWNNNTISNNKFIGGTYGLSGNYTSGTPATNRGNNVYSNNTFEGQSSTGLYLINYTNDIVDGCNIASTGNVLGGTSNVVTNNVISGGFSMSVKNVETAFNNNTVLGAFTLASGGSFSTINGNTFDIQPNFTANLVYVCTGNSFFNATSVGPSNNSGVVEYGLNYGWNA